MVRYKKFLHLLGLSTVFLVALSVASAAGAQVATKSPSSPVSKEHETKIEAFENGLLPLVVEKGKKGKPAALLDRMKELGVPGLSVAVIDGGKIVWARGYGLAELEPARPVTADTLFQAGSISKPVAALGALRLVQEGKLSLDDDVNDFLRTWKVPNSPAQNGEPVTLRRLLTHTAGLTVHGFPGYDRSVEIPTVQEVLDSKGAANTPPVRVDLKPGTQWRYSGGGYTVMQLMVEEAAAVPFDEFLAKAVLEPFGMTMSSFKNPPNQNRIPKNAVGFYPGGRKVEGDWHVYPEMAAAGLWTTASDLARFALGVQQAVSGQANLVLSQESVAEMLRPNLGDWGLGPSLSGEGPTRRFGHSGRDEGFDARLIAYVESGMGAALMINSNENTGFLDEVVASIARAYEWPGFSASEQREYVLQSTEVTKPFAGTYQKEIGSGEFGVFVWQDKLWLTPQLGMRLELLSEGQPDQFFLGGFDGSVVFERDPSGAPTRMRFDLFGEEGVATRKE